MKKFLLVTLAAAMLSNPAIGMDNDDNKPVDSRDLPMECGMLEDGTITLPDRMEVVRGGRNFCVGAAAAVTAGLFAHAVYEGNLFLGTATAGALAMSAHEFMRKEVHIKLYDGQRSLGTILEAVDIEQLIGKLQKQIDDWNKLRNEDPAAAQQVKDKIRRFFQQYKAKNAVSSADASETSDKSQ